MENKSIASVIGFSGHASSSKLHVACVRSIVRFRCYLDEVPKIISNWALATWREKNSHELGRDGYRFQPFEESEAFNVGFGYEFQIPDELPENRVEAIALPEPLKVRMITKSQPLAWALKPVQLAMFKALTKYRCMRPCIDGDYDPSCILRSGPGYRLLSGDYSAATDGLHYDASQVVLSELVGAFKVIDPALARLIEWEGGVHIIEYPKKTGLADCYQTNGQLMGSLLSFPILCIINAFTYCKASGESLEDAQALIHGDDIAFHHTRDVIRKWKQIAHNVGLEPSVGKNYDSKEWVSIDSQFYQKRGSSLVKAPTGKFSCAIRSAEETATYAKALEEGGFSKGFLRYFSKSQLMRTPRSLDVPVSHGGLGTEFSSEPTTTDKLIYSFERYNRRFRDVTRLHDGRRLVRVPSYAAKRAGAKVVRETVSPDQLEVDLSVAENPGFPWKEFNSYKKKMLSTSKNVRHLQAIDLPSAIPLELCKPVTVIASDNYDYHRLKNLSNQV